ncbi:sugar ABC transporter permease [Paenibacillus sp. J5C_2022]|uniref:carbohydrate ABC transporter permease n=1 Tax=Paenibacillus sp. J5C2022 TaxID=2977129 RepID=UPI0021CF40E6|nr:sugar ABC transporter permease [Paenibacillus sp. J5C2022]MCU6707854.1 sugar ABC transporter permease [Paenibacillus sp. J5C2022]
MRKWSQNRYTYMLVMPGLILYVLFFVIPSLLGVVLSFTHISQFSFQAIRFAGWINYVHVLTDSYLNAAIRNSFIFAFASTVLKVVIGMGLAVFLNQQLRMKSYLRTVFFLPAILSTVAVGVFFTSAMHPTTGMINNFLTYIGLDALTQHWLTDRQLAIYSLVMIETWKWAGFTMAIILAGLQSISKDYYESAELEGASSLQKFKHITFPLIMPYFNNALIINLIGGLKVFDLVQAVTQGGPGSATEVFGTLVFKAFGSGRLGEGAAASILLSLIVIAIVIPTWKAIARKEVEV